jgi:hypothetical protein
LNVVAIQQTLELRRQKNWHPNSERQQYEANPGPLQIFPVFIHREPLMVDEEYMESVKMRRINNIKRFSHHRGKDEIRQCVEAQ